MDPFAYPIDSKTLLRKKIKLKKELLEKGGDRLPKRIAVLGGSTTDEIIDQLTLFLLYHGIEPTFYQSAYGQYFEDAVFGNEALDSFHPDVVFVHTNWRNIPAFPTVFHTREEAEALLQSTFSRFSLMWDKLEEKFHCPIIQNNFDRPDRRLLGNSDVSDHRGRTNFIAKLNGLLYAYADSHPTFFVNDLDYLAAAYGLEAWSDPLYWYMYKYCLCLDAVPHLAKSVADIIKSIYGKNKKAAVCDLDNTLWGGVVGDDGVEGLRIGPETPVGQTYSDFQAYLKDLRSIGVLLAVNSKNDEKNALDGLRHPDCILRPEDFAVIKANWENKDENLRAIAEALNLGADSFVFLDDNPAEREIVRRRGLGAAVPTLDRAETYVRTLDRSGYFEVTALSADDLSRAEMYKANVERAELLETAGSYADFLKSLQMKATIRPFEPIYTQRIAQLTNKSNQFNLTTLRCSESDISKMQLSEDYICLYGKLADKFGDNGVVSVIAGRIETQELHMVLWLMSCRVLKRGMEDAMLHTLISVAVKKGINRIIGYYYPTPKNGMVKDFYEKMGFTFLSGDDAGNTVWALDVPSYRQRELYMEIQSE